MPRPIQVYLTEQKKATNHRIGPYLKATSFEKANELCPRKYKVVGRFSKPVGQISTKKSRQ